MAGGGFLTEARNVVGASRSPPLQDVRSTDAVAPLKVLRTEGK